MTGLSESSEMPKLGTRQIPSLSIFSQFSPSWIEPRTPILSIMRPFSAGREGSTSGSVIEGVGEGVRMGLEGGCIFVGVIIGEGIWETVKARVEARVSDA